MRTTCRRVLALVGLVVGLASLAAAALPGFSDRNIAAGNLNPTDTIKVQEIRVTKGAGETVTLSSITVQNLGTAGDGVIDRIAVMDGGLVIGESTAISGLATGITINLGYDMDATTVDLKVYVTVGTAVTGGETVSLRTRVHYVSNGASYTSAWIADLTSETIRNGGFDTIEDTSPDAGFFNPGDVGVVQVTVFSDTDANANGVLWSNANPLVKVENLGTAVNADVAELSVTITTGTWTRTAMKPNVVAGTFTAAEFDDVPPPPPALGGEAVPDNGSLTITVTMKFGAAGTVTDNRTIHTRVTLNVVETGESNAGAVGSPVAYSQAATADTTQTLRKQGFEKIEEESASLSSLTAATGDIIVQTIRCTDSDSNALLVTATQVYIRNTGTAEGTEITKIEVKAGATSLLTLTTAQLGAFKTGAWHPLTTPFAVADDDDQVFKIYYTIGTPVDGHTLRPSVRLEGNEGGTLYSSDEVTYPDTLALRLPGLEFVENMTPPSGGVAYSGQRLLAQQIRGEDLDEDSNNVVVNPIVVKNTGTATSNDVAKVEVWRQDSLSGPEVKLGETTDLSGFRTGGARVELTHDNVIVDAASGAQTYLNIYLTMSEPETMVAGRTLQLETRVLHTENLQSFDKMASSNQWTLETNHRPAVDFTFALSTATASVAAKADFTYEQTIQFTGTATDSDGDAISSWNWDFGDGGTSTLQNPTHRYPNGGTFTVTLTVTDARGVTGSKSKTITVEGPPNVVPTATFTWTPESPAENQTVTFTSTVTDSDQPSGTPHTYEWDFGDATAKSTAANPTHQFAEKKSYTVTLVVKDAQNATVTVTHTVSVGNTAPTLATLTGTPTAPSTGDTATFTAGGYADADSDVVDYYRWSFGDGATIAEGTATATHAYNAPGTYTVSVIAVDARGGESVAKTLQITVSGPTRVVVYAYPNPASTQATFNLLLPDGTTDVTLRVFGIDGRLVLEQKLANGTTTYVWNLLDEAGDPVGNGLYFCVITGDAAEGGTVRSETFRLLVVR